MARETETYIRPGDSSFDSNKSRRNSAGFTLVELVIVITILGILAGIVVFALGGTTLTAAQSACKADAKSVESALESYKSQNGGYPTVPMGTNPSTVGSAILYYAPLTTMSGGGPWLRSAPDPSRYEIWYNASGQVYVTKPGTATDPTDTGGGSSGNDFDISNPNVCTQPGIVQ